jgi:hypothetical protein
LVKHHLGSRVAPTRMSQLLASVAALRRTNSDDFSALLTAQKPDNAQPSK